MRILVATDGSVDGTRAVTLVAAQAWPTGTRIHVLVVDDGDVAASEVLGGEPPIVDTWDAGAEELAQIAHRAGQAIREAGWEVVADVVQGEAPGTIVAEGARLDATLIVVGSRGRSGLQAALGSVSASVVDRAGRSVLVARTDRPFQRVLLADDGSDGAAAGRRIVAQWPAFARTRIGVACVAPLGAPLLPAIGPATWWPGADDYEEAAGASRAARARILERAVDELAVAGRDVTPLAHEGDPTSELLEAAAGHDADLIVLGPHGEAGLSRLVLGNVARDVLQRARCSVLVAR